jgi:hypothetical protein
MSEKQHFNICVDGRPEGRFSSRKKIYWMNHALRRADERGIKIPFYTHKVSGMSAKDVRLKMIGGEMFNPDRDHKHVCGICGHDYPNHGLKCEKDNCRGDHKKIWTKPIPTVQIPFTEKHQQRLWAMDEIGIPHHETWGCDLSNGDDWEGVSDVMTNVDDMKDSDFESYTNELRKEIESKIPHLKPDEQYLYDDYALGVINDLVQEQAGLECFRDDGCLMPQTNDDRGGYAPVLTEWDKVNLDNVELIEYDAPEPQSKLEDITTATFVAKDDTGNYFHFVAHITPPIPRPELFKADLENRRCNTCGTKRLQREFGMGSDFDSHDIRKMIRAIEDNAWIVRTVYRLQGGNYAQYKKEFERCASRYPDMRTRLNTISR